MPMVKEYKRNLSTSLGRILFILHHNNRWMSVSEIGSRTDIERGYWNNLGSMLNNNYKRGYLRSALVIIGKERFRMYKITPKGTKKYFELKSASRRLIERGIIKSIKETPNWKNIPLYSAKRKEREENKLREEITARLSDWRKEEN